MGLYLEHISEGLLASIYQFKLSYAETRNSESATISFKAEIEEAKSGPLLSF